LRTELFLTRLAQYTSRRFLRTRRRGRVSGSGGDWAWALDKGWLQKGRIRGGAKEALLLGCGRWIIRGRGFCAGWFPEAAIARPTKLYL